MNLIPQTVDEIVDAMAAEALAEIRRMADEARIALGWSVSKINRSRGQLARWARARELQKGATQ